MHSVTFDELIAYKMNTGMEAADRFLDRLLAAVKAVTRFDRRKGSFGVGAVG
jgi:hypothetical protein